MSKRLKQSESKEVSVGLPAVTSIASHSLKEMGVRKSLKSLTNLNQFQGFDCPGCAWPDPDDARAIAEFCENGVKAVAEEATKESVDSTFMSNHSVSEMVTWDDYTIGKSGRIAEPLQYNASTDHYEPISWESALELISSELNSLADPSDAIFYTSGRTSNEAAYLYQLFVRRFGTNNLPDCSNMCHESSGVALKETLGIGKGTVNLHDFELADVIMVIGQNPGSNHPRMLTTLQKAARGGATIIHVNPLPETGLKRFRNPQEVTSFFSKGTQLAKHFVPIRINGDVAWLTGLCKAIVEDYEQGNHAAIDRTFVESHTTGFSELLDHLKSVSWQAIEASSGISRGDIESIAHVVANSKCMIVCWAMGLTQHKNAVDNIQAIVNLLLLGGHIGRPGAGACPVRGHSNVQGDRTVGIIEKPPAWLLENIEERYNFNPPKEHGVDTVDAIRLMREQPGKVFIGLGGNFLSAAPDTPIVNDALKHCRMTVHISTKLNRSHLAPGEIAIILPCRGRTEKDLQGNEEQIITVENSMGVVHTSRGALKPHSKECRSEVDIVCSLAEKVLGDTETLRWSEWKRDYSLIRDEIEQVIPGFDNYNERVNKPGGFYLPNAVKDRVFNTASKKANFTTQAIPEWTLKPDQYLLMTIRSHDQYNTTIYGLHDRYRGIYNERRIVFMNRDDMQRANLKDHDLVDIRSYFDDQVRHVERFYVVPYLIPKGCLAAYFPETNPLVPLDSVALKSNTPTSKSIVVALHPHKDV